MSETFVPAACEQQCTRAALGEVGIWMFRFVLTMPGTIWTGVFAVSSFSKDIYTIPAILLFLYNLALWYPLSRLFHDQVQPHKNCTGAGIGMPSYAVYAVFANLVVSTLHDINWSGLRSIGLLRGTIKLATVSFVLAAPVITGNFTFPQVILSALIGSLLGALFATLLFTRWIGYFKVLESHPVISYFGYKHDDSFQRKWLL